MSSESSKQKSGHRGHMWMMAICCGVPIAGFLAIGVLGLSMPSLETALFLLCPIGMMGMMYFMHRDSCSESEKGENTKPALSREESKADPSTSGIEVESGEPAERSGYFKA